MLPICYHFITFASNYQPHSCLRVILQHDSVNLMYPSMLMFFVCVLKKARAERIRLDKQNSQQIR
jgi:hypothetical protein